MTPIVMIVLSFLVAVMILDFFLRNRKMQTRIMLVVLAHTAAGMLSAVYAHSVYNFAPIAVLTFWLGAFLAWFGVRSHIESSILLRMLYTIGNRRIARNDLLQQYQKYYGNDLRLRELQLGGLLRQTKTGRLRPTTKGRLILTIARWLGAKPIESV